MRVIDADAALERVKPYSKSDEEWACTGGAVKKLIHDAINNALTVNAVEVVRCRDCKYLTICNNKLLYAICEKQDTDLSRLKQTQERIFARSASLRLKRTDYLSPLFCRPFLSVCLQAACG